MEQCGDQSPPPRGVHSHSAPLVWGRPLGGGVDGEAADGERVGEGLHRLGVAGGDVVEDPDEAVA